eukprot:scaffold1980_cov55-Cyclotella_meneghiniana.AAC.2
MSGFDQEIDARKPAEDLEKSMEVRQRLMAYVTTRWQESRDFNGRLRRVCPASRTERSKREERETEIHATAELIVRNYTRRRGGNVPGSRERTNCLAHCFVC